MRNDAQVHVPAILLWQCLCGGPDLTQPAFQHVLACEECETLANEMTDALNDIEMTLASPNPTLS